MGGFIPFPSVPSYPGVPALTRPANAALAATPVLSVTAGAVENILITALQSAPQWGIFDSDGNQVGIAPNSQSALQAIGSTLLSQLTGSSQPSLSTGDMEYVREGRISDFQIEQGSFASYNKVQMPANPTVTLILQGSANDRTYLLDALEAACISTDLYSVVTPEYVYVNYSVERFSYQRRPQRGVTLLVVEVVLKEIRPVTSSYAAVQIVQPQDAASTPTESNGITQPAAPPASTALKLQSGISGYLGSMFGGGS